MTTEPLNVQLAREALASYDNAQQIGPDLYRPQMGDAKPISGNELAQRAQAAINEIEAAGFKAYA